MSTNQKEVEEKLSAYLTSGDNQGAILYMQDLMRFATRRESPFYNIAFAIKHPSFGELSPLEWAVLNNEEELFTLVKNYGQNHLNPPLFNHFNVSLEYLAVLSGFKLALPRTTPKVTHVKSTLHGGYNPLMIAASLGHVRVLENFLQLPQYPEGFMFTPTAENNRNLLDIAALHNRADTCKFLLQRPVTWTEQREAQWRELSDYGNALHIAARFGHTQVLTVLLDPHNLPAGFRECTERKDQMDYTALGLAVLHVHADAVKELVVYGAADVTQTQGANNQTLLQLILSSECKHREEYFAADKFSRDKIIRVLLDAGATQEGLTEEQLAYIADLRKRDAQRLVENTVPEELEPIMSLKTSSDDAVKPPQLTSPNKKEPLECLLCDKKFTSAVSLQAHMKSKGHVKQERKERLQKRGQSISSQEMDDNERKRIGLIERLPLLSELINLILIKLERQDLQRFAATSKSIQMIVLKQKLLWKELVFTVYWNMWERLKDKPSLFTDIAHRLPMLERFKVKACHASEEVYNSFFDIPRLCTDLRELDISTVYRDYPISWIGGVLQKNTKLTSLKIEGVVPWKRAKVQAVKDGELNPDQPVPAPVNPKKPWKKKKVKQVKKPDPRKWMVDLDTVLQSGSTSLQHLSLAVSFPEDVQHGLISDLIVGIYKRCPNLTSTKITHNHDNDSLTSMVLKDLVNGVFDACPKLRHVKLMGEWLFGRLSNAEYDELFKRFGALESFKLQGSEISNFDRDIHDYIGDYCTNLKELAMMHSADMVFNGPHFGLSALSNLTSLRVAKEGDLLEGDQFLHTITSQCTKIQKLKLELKPITTPIIQGVAQLGTVLRSLRLTEQMRDHFVSYSMLVRCVNLTRLDLQRITVSEVYTIIEHCKKIQYLELYVLSDEENPANLPQQNNNNQVQNNNNAQPVVNANNNNAAQEGENNNNANNAVEAGQNNANNNEQNNQQGAQQQANNNPAPILKTYIELDVILEKCAELTDLYLCAPLVRESFNRFVVNTSLTRIITLSASGPVINTDWPYFYLAECLPNLVSLSADYSLSFTEVVEQIFVNRFPKLKILLGHTTRHRDLFKRISDQRTNPIMYDY